MNWKIKELAGKYCYKNTLHAIKKKTVENFYAKKKRKEQKGPPIQGHRVKQELNLIAQEMHTR